MQQCLTPLSCSGNVSCERGIPYQWDCEASELQPACLTCQHVRITWHGSANQVTPEALEGASSLGAFLVAQLSALLCEAFLRQDSTGCLEMQSNAEESVENDNSKSRPYDNIRDGISKMPDQSWGNRIMEKRLARIGISHERRSIIVAPPAKANRPTQKTAPASTQQHRVARDTATTPISHSAAPHPSAEEASGASDSAPVLVSFIATSAQAARESSLAPGTVSPRTEKVAAPNADGTSAAPLEGDLRIPISSPGVTSDRESTTAIDGTAPVIVTTSNNTMDNIAPIFAQPGVIEQESKNDDHRAKQKQDSFAKPTSRKYGESKREERAKEHVTQILENLLAGCEWAKIAVLVGIEDYTGSRRVCVKCFDEAATKAHEIEAVLSKHGSSLQRFPHVVHRRGK